MSDYHKQRRNQLKTEGKVVSSRPFDDCHTCPMYPDCPLIMFLNPCVFRTLALWRTRTEEAAQL